MNDVKLAGTPPFPIIYFTFHKQHMNLYRKKSITELQVRLMAPLTHPKPRLRSPHVISLVVFLSSPFLVSHTWKTWSKSLTEPLERSQSALSFSSSLFQ